MERFVKSKVLHLLPVSLNQTPGAKGRRSTAHHRAGHLAQAHTAHSREVAMFGRSDYARTSSSPIGAITERLRALEERVKRAGSREPAAKQDSIGEAIASALSGVAARFRGGADSFSEEAAHFGSDAARLGNQALRRLSREVEHRPLVTLGVAVGVGILVGLVSHRRAK
jgi:ElaB/YqjD/DUF883 family membrane-anchored ribosome-binding protein